MKYEVYRDARFDWRWRLVAKNGKTVADGAEGYSTKSNCMRAVRRIKWLNGYWLVPIVVID